MSTPERASWRAERPGPFRLLSASAVLTLVLMLTVIAFQLSRSAGEPSVPLLGLALAGIALWRLWDLLKLMGRIPLAAVDLADGHAQLRTPVLGTLFTRARLPLDAPLHLAVRSRRGLFGGTYTYRLSSAGVGAALVSAIPVSADSLEEFRAAVTRAGSSLDIARVTVDRFGRPVEDGS